VLTINGRGLKTKISIMRKMLQQQPDIMVWTEHHLPREPNPQVGIHPPPRTTDGVSQAYPKLGGRQGSSWLSTKTSWQAQSHTSFPSLERPRAFLYQMELRRPESVPLLITGAYLPTGPSAPIIRPVLYKHIESQQQAHPHHVHILAGDMNAALYPSDRAPGRHGPSGQSLPTGHQDPGLLPLDPPSQPPHNKGGPEPSTPKMTPTWEQSAE
jgi:hypothetical protein